MCFRRKEKQASPPEPIKKLTCRQRCARRCRRFCCNRIKRCIQKKVFGVPNPKIDDIEEAGIDLGDVKHKLKLKDSATILTIFQKALNLKDSKWNTSIKNIDLIEDYGIDELKRRFSIKGSKESVLKNMVNDYKRGRLSLSNLTKSKYDVRNLDKEQLHTMMNDYVAAQKQKYADLNADDLKKIYAVNKSQEKILDKMVDDFKRGRLSSTALSNKHEFNPKTLNQDKLNSMLQKYIEVQKKKTRPSLLAKLNVEDIKKKFSIKGSKEKLLENFIDDYKKGKTSATRLASKSGFDPKKLNKEDLDNLLKKYNAEQNATFSKSLSAIKNFMEDFKSLQNLQSLINRAKARL